MVTEYDLINRTMSNIPALAGTYCLHVYLPRSTPLSVGRLGEFVLPVGDYVYVGSARGPGGIRARLGRHLRGGGKPRWHVDYLRAVARVVGFCYLVLEVTVGETKISHSTECLWSQALAALLGVYIPVPLFGASDCRRGCHAHLVGFGGQDGERKPQSLLIEMRGVLAEAAGVSEDALQCYAGIESSQLAVMR